ncbi:MAG: HD domain-containing protein [Ruminiclostridium sp.]|nr:HD domain-containing protein [Ruminiclostridium sp.]
MQNFYLILTILSFALSGVYFLMWRKRFNVYSAVFYTIIPFCELGYWLLSNSTTLQEAIIANKIIYVGACFLPLFYMLFIYSICDVRIPKPLTVAAFAAATLIYSSVLSIKHSELFYKDISMEFNGDSPVLIKVYGPMHTVCVIWVIVSFAANLAVIVYSFFKNNKVSIKHVMILFIVDVLAVFFYFGRRLTNSDIDLVGIAYLLMQAGYLLIINRICLYDISDNVIEGLIDSEEHAYVSLDLSFNYLGSNITAKRILPALADLRIDAKIKGSELKAINEWVWDFIEDGKSDLDYTFEDRIYSVNVDYLFNNKKKYGYQITLNDITEERKHLDFIKNYNTILESEVERKTEHISEMHNKLILGLATMVESRDNSTGGHIRRTSDCIRILIDSIKRTGAYDLDDEFCKNLIKAAPMHDLGKIAVDDAILRKPGRFTPEEFEQMKTHAAKGAEMIEQVLEGTDDEDFKRIAENVAHYHHERMDGTGYPEGLTGDEIPLEARIMAIVDVYDALVSKRCYKESMSFEHAFGIIDDGMGKQFDIELRDSFYDARPELEKYYSA